MYILYEKKEGTKAKPSSSRLGACEGQDIFTFIHQPLLQNEWIETLPNNWSKGRAYSEHCPFLCQAHGLT